MEEYTDKDNIRTDYEIEILEGQKMSDVFHEVGLPTRSTGVRTVYIIMKTDDDEGITEEGERSIVRATESELYDWGFLDKDLVHNIYHRVETNSEEYKLLLFTE